MKRWILVNPDYKYFCKKLKCFYKKKERVTQINQPTKYPSNQATNQRCLFKVINITKPDGLLAA